MNKYLFLLVTILLIGCNKQDALNLKEISINNLAPIYNDIKLGEDKISDIKRRYSNLSILDENKSDNRYYITYSIPDYDYIYNTKFILQFNDGYLNNVNILFRINLYENKDYRPLYDKKLNELVLCYGNFDNDKIGINNENYTFYGYSNSNISDHYEPFTYWICGNTKIQIYKNHPSNYGDFEISISAI